MPEKTVDPLRNHIDDVIKCEIRIAYYNYLLDEIKANRLYLSDEKTRNYRNNYNIVLTAVTLDGMALQFASELLKNNITVCLAAVRQNRMAFNFVSDILKTNKDVLLAAKLSDEIDKISNKTSDKTYSSHYILNIPNIPNRN